MLSFVQQFDATFGGEVFDESSKICCMSMYLIKSGNKWWSSLRMAKTVPKTWKACQKTIMDQFLIDHAQDNIIVEWRGLHRDKR